MTSSAFTSESTPPTAHSKEQRLKVLVLDEFLPLPQDAGKTIRTWNLLKPLARRHAVTLLCHGDETDPVISAAKRDVESAGIRVFLAAPLPNLSGASLYLQLISNCFSSLPYSVSKHTTIAFAALLYRLLHEEQFDLIHCEWTPYANYALEKSQVPFVVDAHNLETLIWKRRSQNSKNFAGKLFFADQARKMCRFERQAFAAAQCVASVSEVEASAIAEWGSQRAEVVHNGVDLERFPPSYENRSKEFLFLGSLDWFPNQDAISYLVQKLVPEIRRRRPDATFRVVGRRPSQQLRKILESTAGIQLSPDVDDVLPFLHSAAALVVPLRIGGGTRIKILEGMAAGCPVVSTSIGCEGLSVRDGSDLLICDEAKVFTDACVRLLEHPQVGARLGRAGRCLVEDRYSWASAADKLDTIWQSVAATARVESHA